MGLVKDRGAVHIYIMASKTKRRRERFAQIKLRVPIDLHDQLKADAARVGRSMNEEIIWRIVLFAQKPDPGRMVADAVVESLDWGIMEDMLRAVLRRLAEDDRGGDRERLVTKEILSRYIRWLQNELASKGRDRPLAAEEAQRAALAALHKMTKSEERS